MILLVPGFTLFMHVCSAPDSSVDRMSDTTEGSGVRILNGKSGRGVGANIPSSNIDLTEAHGPCNRRDYTGPLPLGLRISR